jgi:hypothetical protein
MSTGKVQDNWRAPCYVFSVRICSLGEMDLPLNLDSCSEVLAAIGGRLMLLYDCEVGSRCNSKRRSPSRWHSQQHWLDMPIDSCPFWFCGQ